jgi:hypothetical protein
MLVRWTVHSQDKFAERILLLGLNYGDIEVEVVKQRVRVYLEKNKYKSIMSINGKFITAVKVDAKDYIEILTLWESNAKEVSEWSKAIAIPADQEPN